MARDLKIDWTDQQMIVLSERFGKQFLRGSSDYVSQNTLITVRRLTK